MKFLHSFLGFFPLSTLHRVVLAGYKLYSRSNRKNISKLLLSSITILGYIDQKHKNYSSTKLKVLEDE